MRLRTRLRLLAAALLLSATLPAAASAQASPPPPATSAPAAASAPGAYSGALPADQQPAPPRTLRAYWHVWIAFSIAWLLVFGYVLSLGRRFARLEAEVRRL